MPTDQLFKQLLITFFYEFLRLFFPAIAAAIDPDSLVHRSPEMFTDLPGGQLRRADLVFEAGTRGMPLMKVLFHTEVQAERDERMPDRLWQYNTGLEAREGLPVISFLLALYGGTAGISLEQHSRTLFGTVYPRLAYWQVGLRDLDAATYLQSDSPLATALAALMRPGALGRPGLKIALIRRVQASTVDRARLSLIVNVIESFLRLTPEEQRAFREQLRVEGDEAVEATELTWADEMMQRGREQGIAEARREMVTWADEMMQRGREQGMLDAKRDVALRLLSGQFGGLDAAQRARIEAADGAALDRLFDRIPAASSLDEVMAALG